MGIGNLPQEEPAAVAAAINTNLPKYVRVGYVNIPCFMQGMDDDTVKSGMAYDYLQKISYYTNWHYAYVYGDWNTILDKLYKGEIDVLAGISKTPDREGRILFPDYPMGAEIYYIYTYAGHPIAGKGINGLTGRTVSVNQNTNMKGILEHWNALGNRQITITAYSGNEERYRDLYEHRTDATVDTDNAVENKENLVPLVPIGKADYYLAINKNRPDLLEDLNQTLEKINSTNPNFTNDLANKYFSQRAVVASVQDEELQWLNAHPQITVGYIDNYLPLSDKMEDGQVNGIIKDILQSFAENLNIQDKIHFSYIPYNSYDDLVQAVASGQIDMAFPVNNNVAQADKNGLYLSSEVINTRMYLIYTGDYAHLNPQRFSAIRGNSISDYYIHEYYPTAEVIYYDTLEAMLNAVKKGEVDGCILNRFRRDRLLLHTDYADLQSIELKNLYSRSFAVKRGNAELLSILNRGISSLPSGFAFNAAYPYTTLIAPMHFKDYIVQHLFAFMAAAGLITIVFTCLLAYIIIIQRNKQRMQYIARHDSLTGLLNRRSFNDFVDTHGQSFPNDNLIVLAMDINGLKTANDTMGHEAGDELLTGAAATMQQVLAPYGSVYRTGGDEFMAILEALPEEIPTVLQALKTAFGQWQGKKIKHLSVSMGTAHNDNASKMTLQDLISVADQQMYQDKAAYYQRNGHDRRRH
ncbi:MAG: transporter substrate-binding domain-containing protein [Selenomonas sp.]|uniref:transporter substrate-binding domain-containing diguanylate cyclase n=1 Tax=Selenomonas sp. TaxID=2053611 RepID=UPI0025E7E7E9|nr:transporter substrate-binding domain-containing protein [Selenomonas sp.]MCR5757121.1 transporter substrate-binding domain-containing protein [Selenomonas sp.]